MGVLNLAWETSNENRAYPFDDSATLVDDAGAKTPFQILADMKLFVPEGSGKFLYVGALSVTPFLVTAIILASDHLGMAGSPVATITQKFPLVHHYPYQVTPQTDGVGGWISFGTLDGLSYQGRFSLPTQSLLCPLAARWYRTPPISSVRSAGGLPLTGLVRLSGGTDIEIVKECWEVPGHAVASYHEGYCGSDEFGTEVRDVIVFRLKDTLQNGSRNILDLYSGPCSGRPSSRTCNDPQPIEFIGPVAPDCDGNITVEILGCADVLSAKQLITLDEHGDPVHSEETSGVVLACGLGVEDACSQESALPDSSGKLPTDYGDYCDSVSVISLSEGDTTPTDPTYSFDSGDAESHYESSISENFEPSESWIIRFGSFSGSDPDSFLIGGAYSRNVAIYDTEPTNTGYYKQATVAVRLSATPIGALHNAAVVANYQSSGYYVAEIDWDGHYRGFKLFRIAYFDGSNWVNIFSVPVPGLKIGDEYQISLKSSPELGTNDAWLTARLQGVTDDSMDITIGPHYVRGYGPATGPFGVGSNRSAAHYYSFRIDSVTTA